MQLPKPYLRRRIECSIPILNKEIILELRRSVRGHAMSEPRRPSPVFFLDSLYMEPFMFYNPFPSRRLKLLLHLSLLCGRYRFDAKIYRIRFSRSFSLLWTLFGSFLAVLHSLFISTFLSDGDHSEASHQNSCRVPSHTDGEGQTYHSGDPSACLRKT